MKPPTFIQKRNHFYENLDGYGLEIGAFEHPAKLPHRCKVTYCDVINKEDARNLFPEINHDILIEPDIIFDLDNGGLREIKECSQDFIILNHVIEHLFDPISCIIDCFRVLKKNGVLIVSAPDKRYTFDKHRPKTDFSEILNRKERKHKYPIHEDYIDILKYVHPDRLNLPIEDRNYNLEMFLKRREHINIWTDETFKQFLINCFLIGTIKPKLLYEVFSNENQFEYFSAWKNIV